MLGKSTLGVGSKVWVVQKTKRTAGVITKMNIKKAIVDMNGMLYNVPFSMLELA
jgi:FKBP-type peptidyl-prolyl cis-trans isomerase 2